MANSPTMPYVVIVATIILTGGLVGTVMILQHSHFDERADVLADSVDQAAVRLDELEDRTGTVDARVDQIETRVSDVETLAETTDERLGRLAEELFPCCAAAK